MFYVMLALRAELRRRGAFAAREEPNLGGVLDLVALGTVADVVPLDFNNRACRAGLEAHPRGRMQEGVRALFAVAGRDPSRASGFDLGFLLGPRLNAAGRLSDMSLGIECLTTDDRGRALEIAQRLDDLNPARRTIEADMQAQAEGLMAKLWWARAPASACMTRAGTRALVRHSAGRVKDRHHARPSPSPGRSGELRGSGGPFSAASCATRWISSRSANRICSCASAGTPPQRG